MGIQKAIAAFVTGAAGIAAHFGLELSPEVIATAVTVLSTAFVYIFPNKG